MALDNLLVGIREARTARHAPVGTHDGKLGRSGWTQYRLLAKTTV